MYAKYLESSLYGNQNYLLGPSEHERMRFSSGRMAFSGMLCRVALIRTDVSEELGASFIRVTRIGELGGAKLL
jgi:hypothetical protein